MPSEMMNPRGSSPSCFPEEGVCFSNAGQVGAEKMDHMSSYYGSKAGETLSTSSALENRVLMDSQMKTGRDFPEYYLNHGRNVNLWSGMRFVGADRSSIRSLPNGPGHYAGVGTNLTTESASYLLTGDKISLTGVQYENSLFSSTMSDLFIRKLKLPLHSAVYGQSVGASHYEEEEAFEELEAQTIGNLLPGDDDLLSGVTDGFDNCIRLNNVEDVEDLDLFSSVGGLELGEDGSSLSGMMNSNNQLGLSTGSSCGEHPLGELPSRTLFVRNINSSIEDSELKMLFEQYGDIRTMYAACKHRGFVMISYYDLSASCKAMKALQGKLLRRRKLDIHFSIPKENPSQKDINLGTIVVFNLDSFVSNDELRKIFGVYGDIKEIREAPHRSHHKFVEFYDIRAAESALCALNRSDIAGKQIKLEPGWPVGPKRLMQSFSLDPEQGFQLQQQSTPSHLATGFSGSLSLGGITLSSSDNGNIIAPHSEKRVSSSPLVDNVLYHGVSSSIPNGLASTLVRVESGNHYNITESDHLPSHLKFDIQDAPNRDPHSLPEYYYNYNNGLSNGTSFGSPSTNSANCCSARLPEVIDKQQFGRFSSNGSSIEFNDVFGSSGNGSCPPQYIWGNNLHHPQPQAIMWPNSPSFVNGISAGLPQQLHAVHRAPSSHMLNGFLPVNNHQPHVGSAPSINLSLLDRRHSYAGDSFEVSSAFHLPGGSLGNSLISDNNSQQHPLDFIPHNNIFPQTDGGMHESIGLHPHHRRSMGFPARGHQVIPMVSSFDSPNERSRNIRRNEGSFDNRKQFELDVDKILRGDDKRTTLMIKNIPNKYTSKMLLSAIDERHRGTYDFIYLPIDFKNKCNVGYAFINITDPSLIVPFYKTINGKKWEKFNSEKVATLAYVRIQGKAALIAHFQNSSLMNEDKRCRPILFHADGPNAGDQVPFPMGNNIRQRPGKNQAINEENNQKEMPTNCLDGEDYSNGDYSSCGSGKESD